MEIQRTTVNEILEELRSARDRYTSAWREEPVPLDYFIGSSEFCDLPPLTVEQRRAALSVLGDDPKLIFDEEKGTGVNIAVLLWGKGSGKDYITSIIQLYCIYVILCLEEPQLYFKQAPGEPLDVINVAYSANQAKNVYFTKFLERLRRCAWFKKHFNLIQSGRVLGRRKADAWGDVHIGVSSVSFPGNIRAISESSENEAYEGYNIIVWIMDEASAFRSAKRIENASNIYNTLKSSANTRFIGRWKGFVLSYPREEDDWDFTIKLYGESLNSSNMWGSRKFSWQVAPSTTYPGGTYRFVYDRADQRIELDVPELLREDFEKHPEESLGMYCCMPGRSQGAFFESAGTIPRVFSDRPPAFITEGHVIENYDQYGELLFRGIGHRIVKWNFTKFDPEKKYVIHVDCGLTGDRAALVLAHGEPQLVELQFAGGSKDRRWVQIVVEDAHVIWEPDEKNNLRVSINSIETLISQIDEVVPIHMVTYDHWQSASSVETLSMSGLMVKEHNINREDYNLLRSAVYAGDINLLRDELTEYELVRLRKTAGGNIDHPQGGSKDLADALAGVTRLILGELKEKDKPKPVREAGVPVAALAYNPSASGSKDFYVGQASPSVVSPSSYTIPGKLKLPEIPPMPFGIGVPGRARPKLRGLSGSNRDRDRIRNNQFGGADSLISSRIRELK